MRRRTFIAGLGAAAWPLAAPAQQPKVPAVGLLNGVSFEGPYAVAVAAVRQGLQDAGFVEGRNLAIEYRTADGQYERLPELTTDLVRRQVTVIIAIGTSILGLEVKSAASTIPIVFAMGSDAVEVGVVDSLDKPEANERGTTASAESASKRLELLFELRPGAPLVGLLANSRLSGTFEINVESAATSARIIGRELAVFDAGTEEEIETAFTQMALRRARALVVSPDPFLTSRQQQIIALAAQSGLPTIYAARGAAVLGGLMSYGFAANDVYRVAGIYAGQILKGATPAGSPVVLPTRFEFVINNRTAKALRIAIPRRLLVRADEIIE